MPIYEYWCHTCQGKVDVYFSTFTQPYPSCPHCSNNTLTRLLSAFSVRKPDKAIYEDILSDHQLVRGMLHNDPKALAEWNKRMSRGEKTAPEYEDMVGKMEQGEIPTEMKQKAV